jgi:Xaa-Pro aminopeptidase
MLTPAELQANDLVTLEGGASLDGYQPDLARTITIGDVGPMAAKLREAAADALARLRRSLRPGREFNEVHATAAQPLDRAAKRAGRSVFSRLITHGIGLDGYEWPYRDDRPIDLLAGMVLSGEPGLYARNQYGVQHTLLFHLTEDGAELLTPAADLSEMPTA